MQQLRIILFLLVLIALTACKIDMTVNGDGNVKTDAGTFNCSTGTSDDCTQSYVVDVTQCPSYVAPVEDPVTHITPPPTIPPNCTVLVATNANCSALFANGVQWQNCIPDDNGLGETFHAQANQGSHFGSWTGDNVGCNGQTTLTCNRWIDQGSAGTNAQINITANFEQEVDPKNAAYTYDYQGHRASKTVNGVTTYFNYSDIDGQLLGEYQYMTVGGTRKLLPVREYIYLDGMQAAMNVWDNTDPAHPQKQIVYFATNQTGQPMVAWDSSGNPVYERQQTPFMESMGEYSAPNVEVNTLATGVYDDKESSYLQNWNRSRDPNIGFLSPDPSGQNGGINTYLAVNANPVNFVDTDGKEAGALANPAALIALIIAAPAIEKAAHNVGDAISHAMNSSSDGDLQKEIEEAANNREYHQRCDEPPPPGLDPCERAKWNLRKAQDCKAMREAHADRWFDGRYDEAHAIHMEQIDQQIINAEEAVKNACKCKN